ncbi:MAG: tRNA pseudouridine(55) synthase TruB [Anaerolineae bacterium]|nr:tRNA pseudouridine(55) synthase TruB [Anaerolineae bacterium]
MTSHDVVNHVRRLAGVRQVGHTGTLDPSATGVLVVLVGPATRLAQYLANCGKVYRAVLRLGITTTTYDADGEVTGESVVEVAQADFEQALAQFRGNILQVPPMYSAIKVAGKKLYDLARQGKEVQREPRPVTIERVEVLCWDPPTVQIEVACSGGTYIRSLAHDLGQVLGCGAHLATLIRCQVGDFRLEQSHSLDELRELAAEQRFTEALLPPQLALGAMPGVVLNPTQAQAVAHGQAIRPSVECPAGAMLQAWDSQGHLLAVLIPVSPGEWRPKLVFSEAIADARRYLLQESD